MNIIKGPYLQQPTESSMIIMWETSASADSKVEILGAERIHSGHAGNFKKPEHIISTVHQAEYTKIHQVLVAGLEPATTYFYRVCSENEQGMSASETYPIKTAVQSGESFSFAVTSETGGYSGFDQTNGEINKRIFQQIRRYRPDLALFIGDLVDDGSRYEDWEKYFFAPGQELLTTTPFYSCLGNHEDNASWYYDFFAFGETQSYYSFDYGDVHFTCLDSTAFIPPATYPHSDGGIGPGNAQFDFLVHDLQSSSARWKVVFFHYPPYVSGGYQVEDLRQLCPIFEEYGVDVVFNSHTIVYERSWPLYADRVDADKGVVYIVAGGAGAMQEWLLPKREWHTAQSVAVPHFIQVIVTSFAMEFRMINDEGRLFDMYRIQKGHDGKKVHG